MLMRALALLVLLITVPPFQNPFITKFGGPYTSANPNFRKAASQYGIFWIKVFSILGAKDIRNKETLLEICRTEADPMLDKLTPQTEEERKIKEAALYLRTIFVSVADPSSLDAQELKKIEEFLIAASPSVKEHTLSSNLENVLLRYQEFIIGMSMEEAQKRIESMQNQSPATLP